MYQYFELGNGPYCAFTQSKFGITFEDELHVHSSRYVLRNGRFLLNIDKYVTMGKEAYSTSWGESHHE